MSSDVENELNPTKFKLPNKISSDSHPVHPASVPRKLRSAISKRNCTSASASLFDTKRRKHAMHRAALLRKEYLKKSKTGYSEQSRGSAASVSISKEEEEVAQTLFALAGMIPVNGQLLEAKTTGSTNSMHDKPISSSKDPVILKDESENACSRSSSDAKDVIPNLPKLSERRNVSSNLKVSVPPGHLQAISPMLRACDERKLEDSALTSAPSWQNRLNQSKLENVPHHSWQGQNCSSLQSVDIFSNRDRDHPASSERRDNGLMSRPLLGSGADLLPFLSSAIAAPSWLHTAASSSRPVSGDKVPSSVYVSRKSWKRCIAHVHISRLIQVLQMSEKNSGPLDASQLRPSQSSSVPPERKEIKGDVTCHMFGSGVYNNSETGSRVPMHVQHRMNTEEGSKNQRFDFFSLSSGAGPEANHGANRLSNRLDATQATQLHPTAQASSSLLLNNPLSSNAYRDQAAFTSRALASSSHQVHLPMPPYFTNAFEPAHMSHLRNVSSTQPSYQQQQIWSAQLAAQFRPGPLLSSQIANWQNRTHDPRNSLNHIQPQMPPAQSSLEVTGTKYLHISQQQQQQQLVGLRPPLPLTGSMPQNAHLPSNCEDMGGRCRPDGVMPFQLLCNERL